jgi:hypothetical protein
VQKRLIRIGLVMSVAMGMFGIGAAPASAAAVQKCGTVAGTITMSPGLSATSTSDQKVTITGTEKNCVPGAKTGGSGAYKSVLVLKHANCATLAQGNITFKGTGTTTWKNGQKSTYSVTYHDGSGSLDKIETVTMTGKVTKGLFVGKKFTAGFKINAAGANNGACTTTPFKKAPWKQTKAWTIA